MNELINYEAVYRTAPATPGLLNIQQPLRYDQQDISLYQDMNLSRNGLPPPRI